MLSSKQIKKIKLKNNIANKFIKYNTCEMAFKKLQEVINSNYPIKKIKLSDTMKKNLDKLGIKYND